MDKTPPVIEQEYLTGVKVIDIGDLRVARGLSRRPVSSCHHNQLVYDPHERRIWCKDCETDVEGFDAFVLLVKNFSAKTSELEHRAREIEEAEAFKIRTLAGKTIDKAWRSRKMLPCCPSCGSGLFPEDFKNSCGMVGRKYAEARRKKK